MKSKRLIVAGLLGVALVVAGAAAASSSKVTLNGAGSTFVLPLVSIWSNNYHGAHVNYNGIGSGGGIQAICSHQVDFGASDAPLDIKHGYGCHGVIQIPWALAGTSVPYNVSGVPDGLHITGKILAGIYQCKITKWNNPAIKRINRGVHLPNLKITPIHRSDSSGTTYNFTDYLSHISTAFKSKVGRGTQVNFPCGIGAAKSSGVSAALGQTNGAIAYVDVEYALRNQYTYFKVQNRAKKFVWPGVKSCASASHMIRRVPKSNELHIVNPPKNLKRAYPICTYTYAVVWKHPARNVTALKKFLTWAVTSGQKAPGAQKEMYVPIGSKVKKADLATIAKIH